MAIKQLTVFVQNKKGSVATVTDILSRLLECRKKDSDTYSGRKATERKSALKHYRNCIRKMREMTENHARCHKNVNNGCQRKDF